MGNILFNMVRGQRTQRPAPGYEHGELSAQHPPQRTEHSAPTLCTPSFSGSVQQGEVLISENSTRGSERGSVGGAGGPAAPRGVFKRMKNPAMDLDTVHGGGCLDF